MKGFGDELFILPAPDSACYAYAMVNRQDSPYLPRSPEIGRRPLPAKIIFDGTKLPLEASPSQNHYGWYELPFSALFDQSESRPSQSDLPVLVDIFKPDSGPQAAIAYPGRKATRYIYRVACF